MRIKWVGLQEKWIVDLPSLTGAIMTAKPAIKIEVQEVARFSRHKCYKIADKQAVLVLRIISGARTTGILAPIANTRSSNMCKIRLAVGREFATRPVCRIVAS